MRANVYVNLKKTVLDPQGQTILSALRGLGFKHVAGVRQGKCFELDLGPGLNRGQARAEVERIAKEVLTNPVIEEYTYRLED
jgi:phosphoribosylformylglycinamidine synthase